MANKRLDLKEVPVNFLDETKTKARAEGNNAAWMCVCKTLLIGRSYFAYGHKPFTVCPSCSRIYRVSGNVKKQAVSVDEVKGVPNLR